MVGMIRSDMREVLGALLVLSVLGFNQGIAEEAESELDLFVNDAKALELLGGIWEFSIERTVKAPVTNNVGSFPTWPLTPVKETKPPKLVEQKIGSHARLDLRTRDKFRLEMAISNHTDKSCMYVYGEGSWRLRGRLLVLTFVLDDEVDRMAFFVDKLSKEKISVTAVDESFEIMENGKGEFVRKDEASRLEIPEGYALEVDEGNFGPVKQDVAEYYRANLQADIEITNQ